MNPKCSFKNKEDSENKKPGKAKKRIKQNFLKNTNINYPSTLLIYIP
ncbi:hypothetical protein BBU29805_J21 (plasmid) [Borreliella burgdorferi 29805]|nr:hypothetical protein BBU29805_J21 [Borreliella burgdorferi 29805]